jgi:hypothetical protein
LFPLLFVNLNSKPSNDAVELPSFEDFPSVNDSCKMSERLSEILSYGNTYVRMSLKGFFGILVILFPSMAPIIAPPSVLEFARILSPSDDGVLRVSSTSEACWAGLMFVLFGSPFISRLSTLQPYDHSCGRADSSVSISSSGISIRNGI